MKINKIIVIQLIVIIILSSNAFSLTLKTETDLVDVQEKTFNKHVIENVPYAWQQELIYCEFASVEMVLRYYGINISQIEIIYSVGGGYSAACKPNLKTAITPPRIRLPYKLSLWTDETSGGTDDYEFLAQIHGLSFKNIYPKYVTNHKKCWDEYWLTVKDYIDNDVPVITGLDPLAWPIYQELVNLTWTPPKIFGSTHIVVIVGYNETDQTVCVNDPIVGYYQNESEQYKGIYRWVGIEEFKKAVSRIYWELKETRYQLLVFENTTNEPLPKNLASQLIQEKNLKKMEGIKSAYDNDFMNKNFEKFGIDALKELKKDIENVLVKRIPFHKFNLIFNLVYYIFDPIKNLARGFRLESVNKQLLAEFFEENQEMHPNLLNQSIFFKREAKCWDNLSDITFKIVEIIEGNNSIKAMKLAKPLVKEISNYLGDVILLQQTILELPRE